MRYVEPLESMLVWDHNMFIEDPWKAFAYKVKHFLSYAASNDYIIFIKFYTLFWFSA
jgi:hypothetical protein